MRVGIIFAYTDNRRLGRKYRGMIQPMTGTLIAGLLPPGVDVEVINDNSPEDIDWRKDYDLLLLSSIHSDFDRARQISHYWRRRGAKTVYGGFLASTYPRLCQPFFDSIVVGDAEGTMPRLFDDFCRGDLQPLYVSTPLDPRQVPVPRFDLLAGKIPVPLTLEATRGCPYTCEFCALTGVGTRFHTRPPELVVRDIQEGRRMLRGRVPDYQLRLAAFIDNNLGGNLRYLDELCAALEPLDLCFGTQATFNVVARLDKVQALARAGCRVIFVGLESLNPATIDDMKKHQNTIDQTKQVLEQCSRNGILIASGLLLSPVVDDLDYVYSLPARLADCGLHFPAYVCFESPIPGTPHFHRLADEVEPAFLPNALLRDFSGYTLVTRPRRTSPEELTRGYRWLLANVFTPRAKLARLADYLPRYLAHGRWMTAAIDAYRTLIAGDPIHPDRTFLAGTDVPPPEASSVPFAADDFASEAERQAVVGPWRVVDAAGRVLPIWREATKVYQPQGRMAVSLAQLAPRFEREPDLAAVVRAVG